MEVSLIEEALDDLLYVCGADIDITDNLFINPKDESYFPISKHYYDLGKKLNGFRELCNICLSPIGLCKMSKHVLNCHNCLLIETK